MSINNSTKAKSNKHSGGDDKELVERPLHTFILVEPDEILKGTAEGYRKVATKWLTDFNGALFQRKHDPLTGTIESKTYSLFDTLEANTDLTKSELLDQLNRKLGINLIGLVNKLDGTNEYQIDGVKIPNCYRNLDDFKATHTFVIDKISVSFEDWAKVQLVRYTKDLYHPIHYIYYNLDKFTFDDYVSRNIVDYYIPYENYLSNIKVSHPAIVATKQINYASTNVYKDEFNKFKAVQIFEVCIGYTDISDLNEPVTVTFTFDIDLYFSHLKYLYKVFQTYTN